MKKEKKSLFSLLFSFKEVKSALNLNKQLFKEVFSKNKKETIKEDFNEAIFRLNITEEELVKKYNNFKLMNNISSFFSFIVFFILIFSLSSLSLNVIVFSLLLIYFSINTIKFGFHCYQIENKKLDCLKEYILKPRKWIVLNKKIKLED